MEKRRSLDRRIGAWLRAILCAPLVLVFAVAGIRLAQVSHPRRIGHMAAEVDCYLKELALGLIPDRKPILLLERRRAANRALLDLFKPHLRVWEARWQKLLFTPLTRFDAIRLPLGRPVVALGENARYAQVLGMWGDRPPIIQLSPEIDAKGRALAARLGLPEGAWFVCVHAREGGYSPRDESSHAHRNADIGTYRSAMERIVARGGFVVRLGDPTMRPLAPLEGAIDYATSDLRQDWMDIWLAARCRFFVGTSSGLAMLANMFQRPAALTNMIPYGGAYGLAPADISIPKAMLGPGGNSLGLPEIFGSGLSLQRFAAVFAERGVTVVDNTADEIAALTDEMMDRLEGRFETTEDDEDLQRRFRAHLRPADYSYGSLARIGRDWLRANRDLLG